MEKEGIKTWLRTNVPNDLFKTRWARTAINYIPLRYKFTKNSDEKVLALLPVGEKLRDSVGEYASLDLLIVVAIAEWWMDQGAGNDPKARIFGLASKLDDFNFDGLEVQDFTGMILGKAIDDKDWKGIAELVNQKRRMQELESAKAAVRADFSPGQEDDALSEQQVNAGDDDQPYLPAPLAPKL